MTTARKRRHSGWLAVILALAAVAPGGAQQTRLPGVFGEVLEVRVINIEVVVTDRDGVRVPGLPPSPCAMRPPR